MTKRQNYYRTASLLRAQPRATSRHNLVVRWGRRILPSRISWPFWALTAVIIGIVLWMWRDTRWYIDVSRFEIMGASQETAAQVMDVSEILGIHSLWVHVDEIAVRIVEQVSAVTEAKVDCWYYPAVCEIRVTERKPVLVWKHNSNGQESGTYWIDKNGYVFPSRGERPELLMVHGPLPSEERISLDIYRGLSDLAALGIPSEEVIYLPQQGLVWIDARGSRIAFGVGTDMQKRWYVLRALLADLDARGIFPMAVDVRFPSAPTYSLEKSW